MQKSSSWDVVPRRVGFRRKPFAERSAGRATLCLCCGLLACLPVAAQETSGANPDSTLVTGSEATPPATEVREAAPAPAAPAAARDPVTQKRMELARRNQELMTRIAELERQDPIASGLRAKMVERQKEIESLRESLKARLEAIEEIQALEQERRQVVQDLQKLLVESRQRPDASGVSAGSASGGAEAR